MATYQTIIASDFTRSLAPGCYVITEPIRFKNAHGYTLKGPSRSLIDPIGWGRSLWRNNPAAQCIILFDLPEGVAGIEMTGCQGMTFEGINFCRTTPGPLFEDHNSRESNSGMIEWRHCGLYARRDGNANMTNPLKRAGISADKTGHIGLLAVGTNGTDNYKFTRCDFDRLDKAYELRTPQTTKMVFFDCAFRWCNYMGWMGPNPDDQNDKAGSGNPAFYSCTRYGSGPVVFDRCKHACSSMTWVAGWLDTNGDLPMQPLADFSRSSFGYLSIVGGKGKQLKTDIPHEPLVIPAKWDGYPRLYLNGSYPQFQPLLPAGYILNSDRVEKIKDAN